MIEVQIGDSRQLIHSLKDRYVDCVVTSPPYWGLRDYKTEPIIFDGLSDCEHRWDNGTRKKQSGGEPSATTGNDSCGCGHYDVTTHFCSLCGAWRGQLGLEPTPELFIKHLLDFFDDVKLKLKNEGNCFVNLGDTYFGSGTGQYKNPDSKGKMVEGSYVSSSHAKDSINNIHETIKFKCLCMIPQRFAWGMIEHGWILRNEIIWAKPNHMPESVTDRLTKAHEVIYHFVKQQKYYYDLDAIREPCTTHEKRPMGIIRSREWGYEGKYEGNKLHEDFGSPRARTQRQKANVDFFSNKGSGGNFEYGGLDSPDGSHENSKGKNPGDVWNITTQPYPESHFAVFPLELVRRPILAGCPVGGTVLDSFAGSGTVGEFCRHNDRNAILFELNPDYKKLIEDRAMLKIPSLEAWL